VGDDRSYVPSVADTFSNSEEGFDYNEDEYEIDEHGNIRRDPAGRPVLYRRGLGRVAEEGEDDDDEGYDEAEELERERQLAQQYTGRSTGSSGVAYPSVPVPTAQAVGVVQSQLGGHQTGGTLLTYRPAPVTQPQTTTATTDSSLYEGQGYGGWEGVGYPGERHHHPTRLSDVIEEDERSRTSPSRASQASRGLF